MTEDPLLRYLRRRSARRFAALVRARRDEVLGTAYRVLGDRDLAEDVTQEVFLKLLTSRWDPAKVRSGRALLAAHTVRTALARLRSDSRRSIRERKTLERAPSESAGAPFDPLIDVRDAVGRLPNDLRGCVELRYFGGLTLGEVSSALELGLTTVKDRLREAREILKASLAPLAPVVLGALLAEGGESTLPAISMSARFRESLDELARQGPGAAAVVSAGTQAWGAKVLLSLAACSVLVGGAILLAVHSGAVPTGDAERLAAARAPSPAAAPAPDASPTTARTPPMVDAGLELPAAPPRLALPYSVRDKRDGQPLAGAHVALVHWLRGPKPGRAPAVGDVVEVNHLQYWLVETETDGEGGFGFPDAAFASGDDGLSIVQTQLVARKDGYLDGTTVLQTRPLDGFSVTLEGADPATVRVVTGPSETPVRKYRLEYGAVGSEGERNALGPLARPAVEVLVKDAAGSFHFTPTDADWMRTVQVTLTDGRELSGRQFSIEDDAAGPTLVIRVDRPSRILGVVEDAAGSPVGGADVYACNYRQPLEAHAPEFTTRESSRRGARKITSGADGTFAIEPLPNETWLVALSGSSVPAIVHVASPPPEDAIHLVMGRGGGVRIERRDAAGAPVAGELQTLLLLGVEREPPEDVGMIDPFSVPFSLGSSGFRKKTDADGVALLEGLPPGHYYWREHRVRLEVRAGEVKTLADHDPVPDAPAPPVSGARVHGRVTMAGKSLTGTVIVAHQNAPLDADGGYEVSGVLPGSYRLQLPYPPGIPRMSRTIPFEVRPGDTDVEMSWDAPICQVKGRVVLPRGSREALPVSLTIWLQYAEEHQLRTAAPQKLVDLHCDADGSFDQKYLTWGQYFLVARCREFEITVRELEVTQESPPVQELELQLVESRAALSLKLVDGETGAPAPGADFSLARRGGALQIYPDNYPAPSSDHFEWLGLPPGIYDYGVSASAAQGLGFAYGSVEITARSGPVERRVAIPRAGDLWVEVRNADGQRFEEPMPVVELRRADGLPVATPLWVYLDADPRVHRVACGPNGDCRFRGLPIGAYTVAVTRTGYAPASMSLDIVAGQTARLTVPMPRK
jgi:RNA polymerase sigma-70 factor (ECF subfamily)